MEESKKDAPGVLVFPPLLFGGTLAIGFLIQLLWPLHLSSWRHLRLVGGVLAVASAVLAIWGAGTMRRAGTNVNPNAPTLRLVQNGPFRHSRNPLYLSLTLFYLGVSLIFNALWPLLLLPAVLIVAQRGIICREERYLEAKFGDEYRQYRQRVRRWL